MVATPTTTINATRSLIAGHLPIGDACQATDSNAAISIIDERRIVVTPLPAPLPAQPSDPILCYYTNTTTTLQRAFLSGVTHQDFERVIFPQQRILFEANPDARLEVHTCAASGETTVHHIPCSQLQVHQTDWAHTTSTFYASLDPTPQTDLAQES